ncbi:aminoglycoside phosphotransferase family protein [Dechloromonas denitrificans]|uniref:aminoglycoside phosphotransferase family protein n=1 Tax=Dechloromonas denitrificans TaxID=281362 RepID=UPI001CFC04B3|nr:phosphotransferase [Dechloromonas denitrificans]UCV07517.1 phosphotransferase [Dechloromonas denitrificans]
MSRDQLVTDWVASRFPGQSVHITPASADASFRRYFRLTWPDGSTRILMDAPPDKEDCQPFIHVAGLLAKADLAAPRVLDKDLDNGFLVLTDLGRIGYLDALNADLSLADLLIRPVLDVLVKWQLASKASTLPPYDATLLRRELDLFPEWFIGRHRGYALSDDEKSMLDRTFKFLINSALAQPKVFVHRDFMPRNLMVVESAARLTPGIIDFQDAVYGPISYDVVSLFRDAFISWEEEQEIDWVVRYWEKARAAGLPVRADFGDFWRDYELMGLQRHLKVLGIFCRLKYRDGKEKYSEDLPRFMNYARKTAGRYVALKPLLNLLDALEGNTLQEGIRR